jgi:hypothetical protein
MSAQLTRPVIVLQSRVLDIGTLKVSHGQLAVTKVMGESGRHQAGTISGDDVAGGVLRLRCVLMTPSTIIMPMPGKSPR